MKNHDQLSPPDLGLHNFQKKGIEISKNYAKVCYYRGGGQGVGGKEKRSLKRLRRETAFV